MNHKSFIIFGTCPTTISSHNGVINILIQYYDFFFLQKFWKKKQTNKQTNRTLCSHISFTVAIYEYISVNAPYTIKLLRKLCDLIFVTRYIVRINEFISNTSFLFLFLFLNTFCFYANIKFYCNLYPLEIMSFNLEIIYIDIYKINCCF